MLHSCYFAKKPSIVDNNLRSFGHCYDLYLQLACALFQIFSLARVQKMKEKKKAIDSVEKIK